MPEVMSVSKKDVLETVFDVLRQRAQEAVNAMGFKGGSDNKIKVNARLNNKVMGQVNALLNDLNDIYSKNGIAEAEFYAINYPLTDAFREFRFNLRQAKVDEANRDWFGPESPKKKQRTESPKPTQP